MGGKWTLGDAVAAHLCHSITPWDVSHVHNGAAPIGDVWEIGSTVEPFSTDLQFGRRAFDRAVVAVFVIYPAVVSLRGNEQVDRNDVAGLIVGVIPSVALQRGSAWR